MGSPFVAGSSPWAIAVSDFNGDGDADLAIANHAHTFFEADETFFVNLTNPMDATLADAQGVGTIANDDTLTRYQGRQRVK